MIPIWTSLSCSLVRDSMKALSVGIFHPRVGYPDESKGLNFLDIKTKQIIIESSVKFDEPLQEVELVKEKTIEFPSYSTEYLDDEIGGDDPDISVQQSSDAESEPEVQNHLPTWAQQTLSSAGDNIGNLNDPRRTRSDFQREGMRSLVLIICCLKISI